MAAGESFLEGFVEKKQLEKLEGGRRLKDDEKEDKMVIQLLQSWLLFRVLN